MLCVKICYFITEYGAHCNKLKFNSGGNFVKHLKSTVISWITSNFKLEDIFLKEIIIMRLTIKYAKWIEIIKKFLYVIAENNSFY